MALVTETSLRAMLGRGKGLPNPFPIVEGDLLTPAAIDFLRERDISLRRMAQGRGSATQNRLIPVGVSNRHVHLSPKHIELLFGVGYELNPLRELSQKGQYAARETVAIIGPKGTIPNVRILGPSRGATQIEISRTDGYKLGMTPYVRLSGDLQGTPGITLTGTAGTVVVQEGLIMARNHVHLSLDDARKLNVRHGERLVLQAFGERPLIFTDVVARVDARFSLDFHIDLDEANAALLRTGDVVKLIGKKNEIADFAEGEPS